MRRDNRAIYYQQISDYFTSAEYYSGLKSSEPRELQQKLTGSHEPSHLAQNIHVVSHQRMVRNTLLHLPKTTLVILAAHFRDVSHSDVVSGKHPLDLVAKLNVKAPWHHETINLTNLVVMLNAQVRATSHNLRDMRDHAFQTLEKALNEYAAIAPEVEKQWKADREAYRKTNLQRAARHEQSRQEKKLSFVPPISWSERKGE